MREPTRLEELTYDFILIMINPGVVWPLLDTNTSPKEMALNRFTFAKLVSTPSPLEVALRMRMLNLG